MDGRHDRMPILLKSMRQAAAIFFLSALLALLVNILRPGRLPLVDNTSRQARPTIENEENPAIPLADAKAFFQAGAALFLDARSPEQYAEGHIAGARNLPWEQFDARVDEVMRDVSRETLIIAYCDGENCGLGGKLAMALPAQGYVHTRVLIDGWALWQENLLPITTGVEP